MDPVTQILLMGSIELLDLKRCTLTAVEANLYQSFEKTLTQKLMRNGILNFMTFSARDISIPTRVHLSGESWWDKLGCPEEPGRAKPF